MMNVSYIKAAGVAMVCALAMMGCEREEKSNKAPELNAPPTVTPLEMGCDNASSKNALVKALSSDVHNQISTLVGAYADAETLELERRTQQRLAGIGIDLQNVREADGLCHAELHVTLPMSDVSYANRQFSRDGGKLLADRAADLGIKLHNDNFIIAPISYRVVGGDVQLDGGFAALGLIAQVSTGAAYGMANDEQRINLAGRPAPTVRPLQPVEVPRPVPVARTDNTNDTQDPLAREYQNQQAQDTQAQTAPETKNSVSAGSSESVAPVQSTAPVTDNSTQVTIVETDETY